MKRIVLPILLLAISNPAVAMWGWFRKKPAVSTAVAPTTEATISAVEPVAGTEVAKAELQEAPATAPEIEKEPEYTLPQVEKIAGATLALPSERVLVAALNNGDVATVKQLIDEQRIDAAKPFKLLFYAGKTPLEVVLASDKPEKLEIAELLLNAGANKQDLNRFLQDAVAADDYEQVMWLLDRGAKDTEGMALELIERKRAAAKQEPVAVEAEQVVAPTEVKTEEVIAEVAPIVEPIATPAKPARVILMPVRKPAAAQPRIQEVKVEITPVAKPAAVAAPQPLRLRPVTIPAPAQTK